MIGDYISIVAVITLYFNLAFSPVPYEVDCDICKDF